MDFKRILIFVMSTVSVMGIILGGGFLQTPSDTPVDCVLGEDATVSYEAAKQIAILRAGIEGPDVAAVRRMQNSGDAQHWHFAIGGNGFFVTVTVHKETGAVVNSFRFGAESGWPMQNLPVSFEAATLVAMDYLNITAPASVYFNGLTIQQAHNNRAVSYTWSVWVYTYAGVGYEVRIDAQSGEILKNGIRHVVG